MIKRLAMFLVMAAMAISLVGCACCGQQKVAAVEPAPEPAVVQPARPAPPPPPPAPMPKKERN